MGLASKLLSQCGKPSGWFGRRIIRNMNLRHSPVTDWGLKHVSIQNRDTILDVGCGGGITVAKLASMAPEGKVYGIDYSEESVAMARKVNQERIEQGQVEIALGSVSHLPFSNEMFDLVTAVETHYFWPSLSTDMLEVLRVLKPGGALIIIGEAYKGGKHDQQLQKLEQLQLRGTMKFANLTPREHADLFNNAGYSDTQVTENYEKGWICAVGRKHV
jgi:ubiquinone/menaquinone biosynthesis C-methylase UbiE